MFFSNSRLFLKILNTELRNCDFKSTHFWNSDIFRRRIGTKTLEQSKKLLKPYSVNLPVSFNIQSSYFPCFEEDPKSNNFFKYCAVTALGGFFIYYNCYNADLEGIESKSSLPIYKLNDVSKHISKETRIWVTFQGGVYDITDFVDQHPGGNKIMLAAGGSIEPFWKLYGVHNNPEIMATLEEYKIGLLDDNEAAAAKKIDSMDLYANDPQRHPSLRPASVKPFNAEPPSSILVDRFNTPNELFYVRNHLPVPDVDAQTYKLEIVGVNNSKIFVSLEDIQKLPKVTVNAAVMCAGNRRSEMSKVKAVKGLTWRQAAVGNADWSGARLVDVLHRFGVSRDESVQHVQFEGLDSGPDGVKYGASVPAECALDPNHDVLLAYEMNGEPLPRDHGAPIRVIVPGVVGARCVKWLSKVTLSSRESDSHWQQGDYKGLPPGMDWDTVDFTVAPAIQELPIISAICTPEDGDTVELVDGSINIKGYAWSGGGRKVVRVDVSLDKGKTWHVAELTQSNAVASRHWSWTLWHSVIPVAPGHNGEVELWAKAVDSSYNSQPESFEHIWNLRGVLSNAYHKIKVKTIC